MNVMLSCSMNLSFSFKYVILVSSIKPTLLEKAEVRQCIHLVFQFGHPSEALCLPHNSIWDVSRIVF